eukprot:scaffold201382_cov23-Tisochrysis_lutea.AAC.1
MIQTGHYLRSAVEHGQTWALRGGCQLIQAVHVTVLRRRILLQALLNEGWYLVHKQHWTWSEQGAHAVLALLVPRYSVGLVPKAKNHAPFGPGSCTCKECKSTWCRVGS